MFSPSCPENLVCKEDRPLRCRRILRLRSAWLFATLLLLPLYTGAKVPQKDGLPELPRVLIVGGGPNLENNQVAIESNVRYVGKLLPPGAVRTTLFADGDAGHATVLYEEANADPSPGEKVLDLVFSDQAGDDQSASHYRKPNLGGKLDGSSKRASIRQVFTQLQQEYTTSSRRPLLLYFTGHGSSDRRNNENNVYDLWGDHEEISVRDLAQHIERLPQDVPVALVMVQCFSGAFGNLVFEGGDPRGNVTDRDIAGFFATVKERVAAGCTSAVNEADYHDFTSYFFAALTGRDRLGHAVTGADYNGDGRVGMNEAFCYTLIHDESIDVPVCTSDVFLRRFVEMNDSDVFKTPFSKVVSWANAAQKAALTALARRLDLTGETRPAVAYYDRMRIGTQDQRDSARQAQLQYDSFQKEARQSLLRRWPDLRLSSARVPRKVRTEAIAQLNLEVSMGKWKDLLDANDRVDRTEQAIENQEIATSQVIRFVRLCKSVVLAHQLQQTGDATLRARFAKLIEAEGRTPLPPADSFLRASR